MKQRFGFKVRSEVRSPLAVKLTDGEQAPGYPGRRDLLDQISKFLLDHALAITPRNLALAHDVLSGSNSRLERDVRTRLLANKPVTQAWLDETIGQEPASADDEDDLNLLIARLDQTLVQFSSNADKAVITASSCHAALADAAGKLEQDGTVALDVAALTELMQSMLDRVSAVEGDMRQRKEEAAALRRNLEYARREAATDHLTGLANRRAFETMLDREYRAASEADDRLCIAFCDIDRFKLINDVHGHEAGDRVIQAIAKVLQRLSSANCHLARYGGEQFVLLFRGISPVQAREKLDEARQEFARRKLINRETEISIGTVTFSGGVADMFEYAGPRAAMKAADDALYQAKEQGRNRILVAD